MCLAIPGKVISVEEPAPLQRVGRVDFGGIIKEANLSCVPEAGVGDYVIVHVGLAISKIDPDEAERIFQDLKEIDALNAAEAAGGPVEIP
jgi:hydrogenase expression/formation protein HypC